MEFSRAAFLQLAGELTAIAALEVLTRTIFSLERRERSWKPLSLQCFAVLVSSLLVAAIFRRAPIILLLACAYLGVRIAAILLQRRQLSPAVNPTVSQRLHVAELEDSDDEMGHVGGVDFNRQPLSRHSPRQPLTQPQTWQEGGSALGYSGNNSRRAQAEPRGPSGARLWGRPQQTLSPRPQQSVHSSPPPVRRRDHLVNKTALHRSPMVTGAMPHPRSTLYLPQASPPPPPPPPSSSSLLPPLFSHRVPFSFLSDRPAVSTTPPGLVNPGNRCFLNVVLQCLAWTREFNSCLASASTGSEAQVAFVANLTEVLNLCRVLPDGTSTFNSVDPTQLLSSLSQLAPHLVVSPASRLRQSQQDAAELLLCLLDQIHSIMAPDGPASSSHSLSEKKERLLSELSAIKSEDIAALREPLSSLAETDWLLYTTESSSYIHRLFLGQLVEARECQNCRQFSVSTEYFTILPLPVPRLPVPRLQSNGRYKLLDCFRSFTEVEDMSEGNMLQCSFCQQSQDQAGLAPCRRLALLTRPPKILVCQLSRYSYNSLHKSAFKSNVPVSVPLSVDLHPYTLEAKLCSDTPRHSYDLYAVCVHSGAQTTAHGHYVCYCQAANGQWYYYNDDVVRAVNMRRELDSSFVAENAYLLFYALNS